MKIYEKSCGMIVYCCPKNKEADFNECEFLLLHYPQGHWDLPKGHVEENEEEIKTALRELEEETGIKNGDMLPGFREKIQYSFRRKSNLISKTVTFFIYRAHNKKVKISFEHKDFMWLKYDDAVKKITFENARRIVREAKKFISAIDKKK